MEMKTAPCVELLLEPQGVTIRLEVRLVPGEMNLNEEEGSRWFGEIVRDARTMLLHRAIAGDDRPGRLVRSGWHSWSRPEMLPPLLSPEERAALVWVAPEAPVTEPEMPALQELHPETVSPEVSAAEVGEALLAPPPPEIVEEAEPASRRPAPPPEQTKQGKALLTILRKSPEPLDIPKLKERSKLSDYMTRQTLKALKEAGQIEEEWAQTGGRWGGKATYKAR